MKSVRGVTGTRAITDTTGIMLVTFVVVSTVTVAGVGVLEYQKSQAPGEINAAVGASVDGQNLTVHHRGGDSIPASKVEIVAHDPATLRFSGSTAVVVAGDGDDMFEPGERWRWTADEAFGENVSVMLVQATSKEMIDTAAIRPPTDIPVTTTPPVDGVEPTAEFSVSDEEPKAGTVVLFDASGSEDTDGAIEAYEWDLNGDGSWDESGETTEHTFSEPGTVDVRLRVTDDEGNTATVTRTITVENAAPTVSIDSSCEDRMCSFTADAADSDGSISAIDWAFGDGETASGSAVTHEYATGGTYEVTVTVTDDTGGTATADTTVRPRGRLRFVGGEAISPHWNGKKTAVQLTLENRRGTAVDIVEVAVTISKQNVDAVYENDPDRGPFRAEFYVSTTTDGYAESGYRSVYDTGTRIALDEQAVTESGESATVTIAEFGTVRTRCWRWFCWDEFKTKNVPGATVTFEVWLSDGTHRTYEFKA